MSAIVCGKRSNFFEDLPSSPSSSSSPPPVSSKRIRCSSSSSPVRFSPPRSAAGTGAAGASLYYLSCNNNSNLFAAGDSSALDHLIALFPGMDKKLLEQALEACGNDLDSAIRSLNKLRLNSGETMGSAGSNGEAEFRNHTRHSNEGTSNGEAAPAQDPLAAKNLSMDNVEWVELFVREMMSASNIDDAKARASRALEVLEKSILVRAGAEAVQSIQQENVMLKQQLQALIQENNVLKRAVSIQHERQKEFEDKNQELHQLKQLVAQYQEQLRTLEVNNYALTMHLKQAQQNNSIPGRFNPDVF
ncbi:OLC1v1038027C1 [Oldenlandia corymbosa var. corymbosa]|uniref:OLC1v1038027C1 n=1 Tax=Oldenlandia corymbosa var. corymbosa TaxID=529605 RepID=A0AAV1D2J5_OLDCO|nr:OLC1v1038027C1 [Oldenlandia corymbosa var. corymbosa]